MESIGEFFRQVRETKGLTVDEVASKTRIRTDFVKALEDGNFAKLPDQVFARGFVRSYARSLGLDEEDAIHRFVQSAGAYYEKQDERERLRVQQVEEERKRQANRKAVAVAIGIAVLTLIFLLSREQSSVLRRSTPEHTPQNAVHRRRKRCRTGALVKSWNRRPSSQNRRNFRLPHPNRRVTSGAPRCRSLRPAIKTRS